MKKTIRISEKLWSRIEEDGKFGEKASDVLDRLIERLDRLENRSLLKHDIPEPVKIKNEFMPQKAMMPLLLNALFKAPNYRLTAVQARKKVSEQFELRTGDKEILKSGQIRWENAVHWAREKLRKENLILPTEESGRGIWQLSSAGIKGAENAK